MTNEKPPPQKSSLYLDKPVIPTVRNQDSSIGRFLDNILPLCGSRFTVSARCVVIAGVIGQK